MAWKRVLHYFDLHLNKRLNKSPPCRLLNALKRRQVTVMASRITGQSNICSTVCTYCQQRNIKGPRYCPFVRRNHCDRWFPTQKESNMENASIWWRHNGLKDTMTAHVSYYAIYTLHYSHYQPLTKLERGRNVGIPLFFCYRWVRFLRTITPSVKSNVTTTLLSVEGGHPRWQRDYLKVLQGKLLKFSPDSNQIWCAHWVGV